MKDIHCHILFGVDDGSSDIDESIEIIEKAVDNGYSDLILTPHYRFDQKFIVNNKIKKKYFDFLCEEVYKRDINVSLYLGNEITLDEDFFYYLKTDQILSLNDSRYLLIELPFTSKYPNLIDMIKSIMDLGYIVIMAHPERYEKYSVDNFEKLINMGVLLQGNISSLYGKYGEVPKLKIKEMLKRHMIHFMGSDVHHEKQTSYSRINDVKIKIEELTGSSDMANELTCGNIDKVINNEVVEAYQIRKKVTKIKSIKELIGIK